MPSPGQELHHGVGRPVQRCPVLGGAVCASAQSDGVIWGVLLGCSPRHGSQAPCDSVSQPPILSEDAPLLTSAGGVPAACKGASESGRAPAVRAGTAGPAQQRLPALGEGVTQNWAQPANGVRPASSLCQTQVPLAPFSSPREGSGWPGTRHTGGPGAARGAPAKRGWPLNSTPACAT